MKWISFYIFLNISGFFFAQQYTLSGNVKDVDGFSIPYTIVSLKNSQDPNAIFGATTNDDGFFEIKAPQGSYTLVFDAIGFELKEDKIILNNDQVINTTLKPNTVLDEVTAESDKPIYRFELDKKIYDVSQDISSRGSNLSDVLANVPSVSVDIDGTVNLRGSSNVKFLIDGKPTSMLGISNTADVLRTIPASSIERIEVITNPSSRYEAEGTAGILNIVMKKGTNLGFNGNLEAHVGYRANYGTQANLNWNKEKWGYYFNPGLNFSKNYGHNTVQLRQYNATYSSDSLTTQDAIRIRSPFSINFSTGGHYDLTSQSTLSAGIGYRTNDMTNTNDLNYYDYTSDGALFETSNRYEKEDEKDYSVQGNLNFDHNFNDQGKKLSIGLNIQTSGEKEQADLSDSNSNSSEVTYQRSENTEDQHRWIVNADFVNPFKEGANFELGYMGKFSQNKNDFTVQNLENGQWTINDLFTDGIGYREDIQAFYTQYGNTFNKFSFQLGLRSETSQIQVTSRVEDSKVNKNYTNLFPTAYLNYNFSDNTQFQINYSRRIQRPRGRFLNPFFTFADDRNTFRGNPDLNPSYTNSLEMGMNLKLGKKLSLFPQIYYRNTQDDITVYVQQEEITIADQIQTVFVAQPYNVGTQNSYGMELSFQYTPFNWWKMFGEFTYFGYEQLGDSEVFNFNAKDQSWRGRYSSTFKLPAKIDFQLQVGFRGPQTNGQSYRKGIFDMNLGFSKDLFKNNATLNLNVQDLFNSRKMKIQTSGDYYVRDLEMQWRQRQINLSFTYRFNQKKKQERNREGGAGEDDGGMGF